MAPSRFLVLFLSALPALADQAYHATVRFADIPSSATPARVAADAAGNLFIVSNVTTPAGIPQIHIDKVDANGNLLASIEFGGTNASPGFVSSLFFSHDSIAGAAVDPSGNLVIGGSTFASDFPLVSPLFTSIGLGGSGFITKLDSQLKSIIFSTLLGGTKGTTGISALALDQSGNIYVTGQTSEADFPITPGAFQTVIAPGAFYAFASEIASNGNALVFSTYFGDPAVSCLGAPNQCPYSAYSEGAAIALDSKGNVIIAGNTIANHLPITPGAFASSCGDCGISATGFEELAGFLAKFAPDGSRLSLPPTFLSSLRLLPAPPFSPPRCPSTATETSSLLGPPQASFR
jgi:hypothetical protein